LKLTQVFDESKKGTPHNSGFAQRGDLSFKSHQVAWKFSLLLIHYSPETRATQSRGTLPATVGDSANFGQTDKNLT
jgi:hypothetical protein